MSHQKELRPKTEVARRFLEDLQLHGFAVRTQESNMRQSANRAIIITNPRMKSPTPVALQRRIMWRLEAVLTRHIISVTEPHEFLYIVSHHSYLIIIETS